MARLFISWETTLDLKRSAFLDQFLGVSSNWNIERFLASPLDVFPEHEIPTGLVIRPGGWTGLT
jgi:hypothetical protein